MSIPSVVFLAALMALSSSGASSDPRGAVAAPDEGLDAVMASLAARQHGRVEFIEQQFLAVLNHPLESSGEMTYDAPDRLEKRTLAPRAETLLLKGSVLTIDRGKSHRVVDLKTYPQAQPFIESIRATLAGDRPGLERLFTLQFDGNSSKWELTLIPKDEKVKRSVSQVRIDGARDQLLRIEIRQEDGDHSLMTLRPSPAP